MTVFEPEIFEPRILEASDGREGAVEADSGYYPYYGKKKENQPFTLAPLSPKVDENLWKAKPQLSLEERIKRLLKIVPR